MENGPKGVQGNQNITDADRLLEKLFTRASRAGKMTANDLKVLDASQKKIRSSVNALKTSYDKLQANQMLLMQSSGQLSRKLSGAADAAALLAEESDLMTEAQEKASAGQISLIKEQIALLKTAGGHQREIALLDQHRGKTEMARFEAQKKTSMQLAALQVREGATVTEKIGGVFRGLKSAIQLRGTQVGEMAGEYAGVGAAGMGAIAAAAGGLLAIGLLFKSLMENEAKGAKDAATSGLELGDSFTEAAARGRVFSGALQDAAGSWAMQALDTQRVAELSAVAQKEYAVGLAGVGQDYVNSLAMTGEQRFAQRLQIVQFTGDLMKMSAKLGISDEEAVKFGTHLGVLAKGNFKDAEKATLILGEEALRLGVPMSGLVDIFGLLAQQADFAGQKSSDLTSQLVDQTLAITDALREGSAHGLRGLGNLDPEKTQRLAASLTQTMMGMSQTRVTALTMSSGQTLEESLNALLGKDQLSLRARAVQGAMAQAGVTDPKKMTAVQALQVGQMSGVHGEIGDITKMGYELASMKSLTEGGIRSRMAKITDDKLDAARSVGGDIQAGADVMQTISFTLKEILRAILRAASFMPGGSDQHMQDLYKKFKDSDNPGRGYGQRNDLYRQPRAVGVS